MSSFIERFSIAGSAGVLGIMIVLGLYGLGSLMTADPDASRTRVPGSEAFLVLEGRGIPIGNYDRRSQPTQDLAPGEPEREPALEEALETDAPVDDGLLELEPDTFGEALYVADVDGAAAPAAATPAPAPAQTAAADTPAPAPNTAPPPATAPPPPPPRPTPTAEPTPAPEPTPPPPPSPEPTLPVD